MRLRFLSPIIFILCIIFPLTHIQAQIMTSSVTVGNNSEMDITVTVNDNDDKVYFEVSGPSTKWFGVGFNTTDMSGSAYAIILNNSGGNPVEYNMNGTTAPTLQTSQDLSNISSSTSGTVKTFTFERDLNTSDANDYTFSSSTTSLDIAWAIGSGTSLAYHSTNRGSSTMTFTDPCTTAVVLDTLPDTFICLGDSIDVFGTYQNQPGWYSETYLNEIGCDSLTEHILIMVDSSMFITFDTLELCAGDSVEVNGEMVFEPGEYSDTLQNVNGCDSISNVEVYLTIVDTSVTFNQANPSVLTANATDIASYRWIDCSSGDTIPNETFQNFEAAVSGAYALVITQMGCTDTSACYQLAGTFSLEENSTDLAVDISQTDETAHLQFHTNFNKIQIHISNLSGQKLYQQKFENKQEISISTQGLSKGIYFMRIVADKKIFEGKIVF